MAAIGFNFNAASVKPQDDFTPIPAGSYIAQITDSKIGPTSKMTGMRLDLTWTIMDGQFANRKVFDSINVQNQSQKAEEIGQRQLSAICHAVGVMNLQDSNQLHGRPCKLAVTIREKQEKEKGNPSAGHWPEKNEISGYSSAGASPSAAPAFAQQAAAAPAASSSAPPWARAAA